MLQSNVDIYLMQVIIFLRSPYMYYIIIIMSFLKWRYMLISMKNFTSTMCRSSPVKQITGRFYCTEKKEDLTVPMLKTRLYQLMGTSEGFNPSESVEIPSDFELPKVQDNLPKRTMKDSYSQAFIPLRSDPILRERYITFMGLVRMGRILEDMDLFSVWLCYKHMYNPDFNTKTSPYMVRTVLVDEIIFNDQHEAQVAEDLRLSGHVSWTGHSTMETTVWLEEFKDGKWQMICRAVFLMAARDRRTRNPAFVNSLKAETPEEKAIFKIGSDRKRRRRELIAEEKMRRPPNRDEMDIIHEQYLAAVDLNNIKLSMWRPPPGCVWIHNAQLSNLIFCQPEDRNLYNDVFEGFLMRHALELSWATALLLSKMTSKLRFISYVGFKHPLPVGSLMRMFSSVTYTHENFLQVMTYAEVFEPKKAEKYTTNIFHYSFVTEKKTTMVAPFTYHEAILYCEGRRHNQEMLTRNLEESHSVTVKFLKTISKQ